MKFLKIKDYIINAEEISHIEECYFPGGNGIKLFTKDGNKNEINIPLEKMYEILQKLEIEDTRMIGEKIYAVDAISVNEIDDEEDEKNMKFIK